MQESRKNVVHMSQFGRSRSRTGAGSDLTNSCGELAAERLANAISKALKRSSDDLLELTDQVTGLEMRRLYGEATAFARDRAGALENEFRKQYFQRYLRVCRRERAHAKKSSDLDLDQLSLVASDELEETLATNTIANAINNLCGEEMFGLSKRVGAMLDDPDLELGENPLSPEVIADSIMDLMQSHELPVKARLALIPVLNKHLPQAVRSIYQELNQFLIEHGVLPTIRISLRKPAQNPAGLSGASNLDLSGQQPPATGGGGSDLLSVLQQLVSLGQASSPLAGMPMTAGQTRVSPGQIVPNASQSLSVPIGSAPIFVQTLTQLQRGQPEAWAGVGLDNSGYSNGQVNVLHLLRDSSSIADLPQVDAMTLDIVAMVFDYILEDHRIPDAMKALIGRLQIPVLKVAMLDRGFFSQKTHAARQLLDALADASMGWDESEGHASGLYVKVSQIVEMVLNEFDDKLDTFISALNDFRDYQAEEQERINARTSRSAKIVQQREQEQIAELVAGDEIKTRLFAEGMPSVIHDFLDQVWKRRLAGILVLSGEGSPAWQEALKTIDDLIWSIKPKVSSDERKQLVALLPNLLGRLEDGFHDLDEPRENRDLFFTSLVRCHADAVRAGLQERSQASADSAEQTAEVETLPAGQEDSSPVSAGNDDFEAIPELDEVVDPDTAIMAELASPPEETSPTLIHLDLTEGNVFSQGVQEQPDGRSFVSLLKRGTWIEFDQDDGSRQLAKLAWISPHQGLYLFTNRLGQRAMSISPEGLASKFDAGSVRSVDAMPLIDRAMSKLMDQLSKAAA
jgi:hypothetical protein